MNLLAEGQNKIKLKFDFTPTPTCHRHNLSALRNPAKCHGDFAFCLITLILFTVNTLNYIAAVVYCFLHLLAG